MPFIALRSIVAAFLVMGALAGSTAVATAKDCPYTPTPGSTERKAIMESLRAPVVKELKQRVIFVVQRLAVCGDWAFLEAMPRKPNGRPVDWSLGVYADAVADDMCGGYIHALLVKTGGHWRVREHVVCATDVPWVGWAEQYGAPAALFPRFD